MKNHLNYSNLRRKLNKNTKNSQTLSTIKPKIHGKSIYF